MRRGRERGRERGKRGREGEGKDREREEMRRGRDLFCMYIIYSDTLTPFSPQGKIVECVHCGCKGCSG